MNRADRVRDRAATRRVSMRQGATPVDTARFRDDYGFALTQEGYEKLNIDQADFKGKYDTALASIDTAESQLPKQTTDKAWGDYKKSWFPVRVVNGNNVEQTYMVPFEAIDAMNTETFNQGDGSFVGYWFNKEGQAVASHADGGVYYNVDVTPRGISDSYGKELHESIGGIEPELKDKFYEKSDPIFAKAREEGGAVLSGERDILTASKTLRDDQLAGAESDYRQAQEAGHLALSQGGKRGIDTSALKPRGVNY